MMTNDSDGNEAFGAIVNPVWCERELGLGTDNRSDVTVLSVDTSNLLDLSDACSTGG